MRIESYDIRLPDSVPRIGATERIAAYGCDSELYRNVPIQRGELFIMLPLGPMVMMVSGRIFWVLVLLSY